MNPKTYRKPLSRYFPAYHPKAGQLTYFVEKFWGALADLKLVDENDPVFENFPDGIIDLSKAKIAAKFHTIRGGNKIKVGDFIQFYCWVCKPYRSKQIVIAPPIEVKKTWDFALEAHPEEVVMRMGQDTFLEGNLLEEISNNDGLELEDFKAWFQWGKKSFDGQIICWNDKIEY